MDVQLHPGLSTGHAEVDRQHAEIFSGFDRLLEAMHRGEGRRAVEEVLGMLERVLPEHFRTEEALLERMRDPQAAAHRATHEQFLVQVRGLVGRLGAEGPSSQLAIDTCQRVGSWLKTHVGREDGGLRGPR